MRLRCRVALAIVPLMSILFLTGFGDGSSRTLDVPLVVTAAPAYDPLAALHGADRFPKGAQLLWIHEGATEPLVAGFAASADASVRYDGKAILFAGRKTSGDSWQIWEVTLADRTVRQVTSGSADAVRPLYLPGQRIVFARRGSQGFQMFAANLDGKEELPLTYLPGSALPQDVLADGRILFAASYPMGSGFTPELYLVYSDGSGVESYRCDHGGSRWGGRQVSSGDVVFTHGSSLARFTSPLATEAHIGTPHAQFAGGVVELPSGEWLLSARMSSGQPYALNLWKPEINLGGDGLMQRGSTLTTVFAKAHENLVDPVVIAPRERPRIHPSSLHDWNYANLLALDARQSREGDMKGTPKTLKMETLDASGHATVLGTAPVEADGSFFVKAPADRPIRLTLLDDKGITVRQERGWFWSRRGEQRVCVGCHTGPEHAAENRVPAVLLRSTTPVDLTGAVTRQTAQGSR